MVTASQTHTCTHAPAHALDVQRRRSDKSCSIISLYRVRTLTTIGIVMLCTILCILPRHISGIRRRHESQLDSTSTTSLQFAGGDPMRIPSAIPRKDGSVYMRQAFKPPIKQQIRESINRRPALRDPLEAVIFAGNAPQNDAVIKGVTDMLLAQHTKDSVEWLDSAKQDDRELLGPMVKHCTKLFAARGTDADCVVQCHPKSDCGLQSARLCKHLKSDYEPYVTCLDREHRWCETFGYFSGEKFPQFHPTEFTEQEKQEETLVYCGNLFQWRGVKLPCLRKCTVFSMRQKNPDGYFAWRAKHQMLYKYPDKDPSEPEDPDHGKFVQCEQVASDMCRFLRQQFWRECYERIKNKCLRNTGDWNDMVAT
jgi:hypothetical protein